VPEIYLRERGDDLIIGAKTKGIGVEAESANHLERILGDGSYLLTDCGAGEVREVERIDFDCSGCEVLKPENQCSRWVGGALF